MKKEGMLKTMATVGFCALALSSAQAAKITIPDGEINPGGYYNASVSIDPQADEMFYYKGFQFDLEMKKGLSVDFSSSTTIAGFSLKGDAYGDNACRLIVFTDGEAVNTADNIMTIAFRAADDASAGPNTIQIDNVIFSSPDGLDIPLDESRFTITVTVVQEPEPEIPDHPNVPDIPSADGWYGNGNGTFVSQLKIREGNELGMYLNEPVGGYADAWEFFWYGPEGEELGDLRDIRVTARLYGAAAESGKYQAISENTYTVDAINYDTGGGVFFDQVFGTATVSVYKRPQIPASLLRKGQGNPEVGTSCTFVVMMTPLDNQEILDLGYTYTYGYTDRQGSMHELETTDLRYTHTTREIYDNPEYDFWAYSRWTYPDGSIVTSGLRYLDGREDADFDASVFSGSRGAHSNGASGVEAAGNDQVTPTAIYTLDGRYAGTDPGVLDHGIYIILYGDTVRKVKI